MAVMQAVNDTPLILVHTDFWLLRLCPYSLQSGLVFTTFRFYLFIPVLPELAFNKAILYISFIEINAMSFCKVCFFSRRGATFRESNYPPFRIPHPDAN